MQSQHGPSHLHSGGTSSYVRGRYSSSGPIAVFVLAGKTGSGKSSLIKLLGGRDLLGNEPVADGGLDSCTQTPTAYVAVVNSRKILLLDTPGFDDSAVGNLQVLNEIAANLYNFALERQEFETHGVIFLHDISETRFAGSQRKTLEILKALCGPKGMNNCIIGTTMWNLPGTGRFRSEELREKEFLKSHWKGILKTTRIPENDKNVVVGIISDILARPPVLLKVQEQMLRPPHTLEATTVGQITIPEGRAEAEKLRRDFEDKQREFNEERERQQAEFEREREEMRKQAERERATQEAEWQRIDEERERREEEQWIKHQDEINNLDTMYKQRAGEEEKRRRAESERQQKEGEKRWQEFVQHQQETLDRAEKERVRWYQQERVRQEEVSQRALKREEQRINLLRAEFQRAAEPPPTTAWWEPLVGIATAILGGLFGRSH